MAVNVLIPLWSKKRTKKKVQIRWGNHTNIYKNTGNRKHKIRLNGKKIKEVYVQKLINQRAKKKKRTSKYYSKYCETNASKK